MRALIPNAAGLILFSMLFFYAVCATISRYGEVAGGSIEVLERQRPQQIGQDETAERALTRMSVWQEPVNAKKC